MTEDQFRLFCPHEFIPLLLMVELKKNIDLWFLVLSASVQFQNPYQDLCFTYGSIPTNNTIRQQSLSAFSCEVKSRNSSINIPNWRFKQADADLLTRLLINQHLKDVLGTFDMLRVCGEIVTIRIYIRFAFHSNGKSKQRTR